MRPRTCLDLCLAARTTSPFGACAPLRKDRVNPPLTLRHMKEGLRALPMATPTSVFTSTRRAGFSTRRAARAAVRTKSLARCSKLYAFFFEVCGNDGYDAVEMARRMLLSAIMIGQIERPTVLVVDD